jgi:hypothetical protein
MLTGTGTRSIPVYWRRLRFKKWTFSFQANNETGGWGLLCPASRQYAPRYRYCTGLGLVETGWPNQEWVDNEPVVVECVDALPVSLCLGGWVLVIQDQPTRLTRPPFCNAKIDICDSAAMWYLIHTSSILLKLKSSNSIFP